MSVLEDKIKKNRDLFDAAEPAEGHLERFSAKLEGLHEQAKNTPVRFLPGRKIIRIAAVIIVLLGLSITIYFINPVRQQNRVAASELPVELQEAKMYYTSLTDKKMQQINRCALSENQASGIRENAQQQLQVLDSNSVILENDLKQNKDNQRIRNALILNYKTKSDLLDEILKRLCKI
jgi:hypothetical protein